MNRARTLLALIAILHTPHGRGNTALRMCMRTDVMELLPMPMKVVDMVPDNPGAWLYPCHVNDTA